MNHTGPRPRKYGWLYQTDHVLKVSFPRSSDQHIKCSWSINDTQDCKICTITIPLTPWKYGDVGIDAFYIVKMMVHSSSCCLWYTVRTWTLSLLYIYYQNQALRIEQTTSSRLLNVYRKKCNQTLYLQYSFLSLITSSKYMLYNLLFEQYAKGS